MKAPKLSRAERRKSIVRTAAHLFAEVGFRGGTTRELARRAGITEPVLYEHFATKSDLYSAIIDESSDSGFADSRKALEKLAEAGDPAAFFRALAGRIADHQATNPNYLRLVLFSALEKHELAQLCFERHATVIHELVTRFIKRQIELGVFRELDAALAARSFMGMVMHYVIFDQHFGFKLVRSSKKRALESMVDLYLHGLKSK